MDRKFNVGEMVWFTFNAAMFGPNYVARQFRIESSSELDDGQYSYEVSCEVDEKSGKRKIVKGVSEQLLYKNEDDALVACENLKKDALNRINKK